MADLESSRGLLALLAKDSPLGRPIKPAQDCDSSINRRDGGRGANSVYVFRHMSFAIERFGSFAGLCQLRVCPEDRSPVSEVL